MSDEVSIVLPFRNSERFLAEAVESVLQQTYSNWELLLIDDASQDRSSKIAMEYVNQNPDRIRCLWHSDRKNHGISASRNLGIRNATGTYTAFLDSDDAWFPEKLTQQTGILDAYPEVSMVFGTAHNWFGWTGNPSDSEKDNIYLPSLPPDQIFRPPSLLLEMMRSKLPVPATSNPLYRTGMVRRIGGFEESFPMIGEVEAFTMKVYLSETVYFANQCWSKYRVREDSIRATTPQIRDGRNIMLAVLQWFETYTEGVPGAGPEIKTAVRTRLRDFRESRRRRIANQLKEWLWPD